MKRQGTSSNSRFTDIDYCHVFCGGACKNLANLPLRRQARQRREPVIVM